MTEQSGRWSKDGDLPDMLMGTMKLERLGSCWFRLLAIVTPAGVLAPHLALWGYCECRWLRSGMIFPTRDQISGSRISQARCAS